MIDQFSFQRVHVHAVEFFHLFFQTPDVKIIKSALPKARQRFVDFCKGQTQLPYAFPFLAAQLARDALLQDLHYSGGCSCSRFADEQMDVLRHDDVSQLARNCNGRALPPTI